MKSKRGWEREKCLRLVIKILIYFYKELEIVTLSLKLNLKEIKERKNIIKNKERIIENEERKLRKWWKYWYFHEIDNHANWEIERGTKNKIRNKERISLQLSFREMHEFTPTLLETISSAKIVVRVNFLHKKWEKKEKEKKVREGGREGWHKFVPSELLSSKNSSKRLKRSKENEA